MKNRGFSLVELIVVVAIMGVALGIGGYSLNAISLSKAKNCATKINSGLDRTRMQSYSSDGGAYGTAELQIYRKNNAVYLKKNYEGTEEKIGGGNIIVTYTVKNGTETSLSTTPLRFSFDKSSGAFKTTYLGTQAAGDIATITVSGGGKTYTITCYAKTGRTKME